MIRRTKIICTIGPACNSLEKIKALIEAGMNVARINMSHSTRDEHQKTIDLVKKARKLLNVPVAIMLDTKGLEIRIGEIKDNSLELTRGSHWKLVSEEVLGDITKVTVTPPSLLHNLTVGTHVFFNDGYIDSKVVSIEKDGVIVEILNGGMISSHKGINIPGLRFSDVNLTDEDITDIRFACKNNLEFVAVSFVSRAEDILEVKNLMNKEGRPNTLVIAKIENREAVKNFDSIIQVADGVMIARGDLGVEVPLSQVPGLQKEMIRKCYLAGKPAVTATQMLESMINSPRPTRAEVSDVANAIYDSTSVVMLSAETAVGLYPVETVQMMVNIIVETEANFNYRDFFDHHSKLVYTDVPSSVTLATVKTAYTAHAKAIFAFTSRGSTPRLLARLRPPMPIIALTPYEKSYHQMAFNWGVIPFLGEKSEGFKEGFDQISQFALDQGLVDYGDLVVCTAGYTFGISGTTNMMIVENIGKVLIRGFKGQGTSVYGNVLLVHSSDTVQPYSVRNKIIVIPKCDESYIPLIKECSGVVLQNHIDDEFSEAFLFNVASELQIPVVVRADAAFRILKEGQLVTIDPEKALVYKGVTINQ
ncbi:MAG: pyruvate kinase [Waddliaceae bacterium]